MPAHEKGLNCLGNLKLSTLWVSVFLLHRKRELYQKPKCNNTLPYNLPLARSLFTECLETAFHCWASFDYMTDVKYIARTYFLSQFGEHTLVAFIFKRWIIFQVCCGLFLERPTAKTQIAHSLGMCNSCAGKKLNTWDVQKWYISKQSKCGRNIGRHQAPYRVINQHSRREWDGIAGLSISILTTHWFFLFVVAIIDSTSFLRISSS